MKSGLFSKLVGSLVIFAAVFISLPALAIDTAVLDYLTEATKNEILNPPGQNTTLRNFQIQDTWIWLRLIKISNPQWGDGIFDAPNGAFIEKLFQLASAGDIPVSFKTSENQKLFPSFLGGPEDWKSILFKGQKQAFSLLLFGKLVPYEKLMDVAADPQSVSTVDESVLKRIFATELDRFRNTITDKKEKGEFSRTWTDTLQFHDKAFCVTALGSGMGSI